MKKEQYIYLNWMLIKQAYEALWRQGSKGGQKFHEAMGIHYGAYYDILYQNKKPSKKMLFKVEEKTGIRKEILTGEERLYLKGFSESDALKFCGMCGVGNTGKRDEKDEIWQKAQKCWRDLNREKELEGFTWEKEENKEKEETVRIADVDSIVYYFVNKSKISHAGKIYGMADVLVRYLKEMDMDALMAIGKKQRKKLKRRCLNRIRIIEALEAMEEEKKEKSGKKS